MVFSDYFELQNNAERLPSANAGSNITLEYLKVNSKRKYFVIF